MAKKQKNKKHFIFIILLVIILIIGYVDSFQIESWHEVEDPDKWDKYNEYNQLGFMMLWLALFVVAGFIWFFLRRDLSEALAFVIPGVIMVLTGLNDVVFFLVGKYRMTDNMCWFNDYGSIIGTFSHWLGHTCTTALDLWLISIIGLVIAYIVFRILISLKFDNKWFKK